MSRPESRSARTRPTRVAVVVGAMIGAVTLAGCGAGQITQTNTQVSAVDGANATAGPINIRNARIEFDTAAQNTDVVYPAGASAPLDMTIVNTANEADRLVAASSPVASAVEISSDAAVAGGQALIVQGVPAQPAATAAPAATDTAIPSPAPTPSATPTPAATPTTAAVAGESRTASVVLTGLGQNLQVGPTYPVVLTFERAGDVRVDVPIANPGTPRQDAP